jgi:glycosyltransferase involved in cell wall biosynthesis
MKYKVSVIMPSLNEQDNLPLAVKNVTDCFNSLNISGQIIVVNDGSSDRTGEIAVSLSGKYPFLKVIHHASPQGMGGSFWDGVKEAGGEVVVMLPGDGENDAYEILRYLPLMEYVDIVVPFIYNKNVRPLSRRILSSLYTGIINLSFGMSLNYMNGTVMYRRCVFDNIRLRCKGFFYQTELLIKCLRNGYLYAEVPCALRQRGEGFSKATTFKSIRKVAQDYIATLIDVYITDRERKSLSPDSVTALSWRRIKESI